MKPSTNRLATDRRRALGAISIATEVNRPANTGGWLGAVIVTRPPEWNTNTRSLLRAIIRTTPFTDVVTDALKVPAMQPIAGHC